jgi:hypothetical protein
MTSCGSCEKKNITDLDSWTPTHSDQDPLPVEPSSNWQEQEQEHDQEHDQEPIDWQSQIISKKFPESVLCDIVNCVDLRTLIKTQKLSLEFIHRFIINCSEYTSHEETDISISYIAYYQNYTTEEIINYKPEKEPLETAPLTGAPGAKGPD